VYLLVRPIIVQNIEPIIQEKAGEKINGTLTWRSIDLDPHYDLQFNYPELKDENGRDVFSSSFLTVKWTIPALYNYLMNKGDAVDVVNGIVVEDPVVHIYEKEGGTWNVQNIVKPSEEESSGTFKGNVVLTKGTADIPSSRGTSMNSKT